MKKKSCAIISSQAFSLFNFRGYLIADLVAQGFCVFALAPDYNDEIRKKILLLGATPIDFKLNRTGMNPVGDLLDTFGLIFLLRKLRPDVTLGYFVKPVVFGTLAAWVARVPKKVAMIEGLGYVFTPSGTKQGFQRKMLLQVVSFLYQFSLKRAQKVIFLNGDDLREFVDNGLVDKDKALNLGGIGVDLKEWKMIPPVVAPLTFLMVARLLKEKGIVEYAAAARQLKISYPDVRFVLLGGLDPNPGGIKQSQVDQWVAEGILEWPGHVDVKPWLMKSSVFVLPSYREGVPRSTQEAMATGRAVITTDAPGCRETVEDGVNGFLVPVRDVGALTSAMLKFVKKPELIKAMGFESRKLAEKRFDVRAINDQLLKILEV